jgi:hypothetical protein
MSPHFQYVIVVSKEGKMPFIVSWYVSSEDEVLPSSAVDLYPKGMG